MSVGPSAGPASTTTRRAPGGRPVRFSPRCGWTGLTAPGVIRRRHRRGERFLAYIEQILVPTLHPGDIVIADNLSAHTVAGVRQAIKSTSARRSPTSRGVAQLQVGGT